MKNRLLFFAWGIMGIVIITTSSCYRNPIERNTIVFHNDVKQVQDSLIRMMYFLNKFPKNDSCCNTNYGFNFEGKLEFNGGPGKQDSARADSIKVFSKFSKNEGQDFLKLANYLKRNYITAGYSYNNTKLWSFYYRYLPERGYNEYRSIMLLDDSDTSLIYPYNKILDHKQKLYLLAASDAIIK